AATARIDLLELLELRMAESVKQEQYPRFLELLDHFRALGGQPGIELLYHEALAHHQAQSAREARDAAAFVVERGGRDHPLYVPALALYQQVGPAAERADAAYETARASLAGLSQALDRGASRLRVQD